MAVNTVAKIALPPLDFDEFNALDILINGEISELAYQTRVTRDLPIPDTRLRLLKALRAIRSKVDAARPAHYAEAIRAARAESVCDT
jgi:hypothetical protein